MQSVRIFFEKVGLAKYISHLDLMRCFSRAIKRADIDIWYTEGFNPHPFMTFSLPLSLGTVSLCESVDIRINGEMPFEEIKESLNATLPTGIRITSVSSPIHKADEICFAEYEITFNTANVEAVSSAVQSRINADEILVEKKTKQGKKKILKEINIKDSIKSFNTAVLKDKVLLNTVLAAGNKGNINPSLLIDAVTKDVRDDIESIDIVKKKMLLSDMTEFI